MALLLTELLEKLKREDEVYLLELLSIDSEMLVDRFSDIIAEKQDGLEEEYENE